MTEAASLLVWPRDYNVIPQDVFVREDIYLLELEKVFRGKAWHPVAHVAEIPGVGDYKTATVGESPMLAIRGDDGAVRVFFNSCPHRGSQLTTRAQGRACEIECPHHRWIFDLAGDLVSAPGSVDFPESFRKQEHGMRRARSEIVCGLVFATLDDETPDLDENLGEAKDFICKALGGGPLDLLGSQKVVYAGNWKEYNDGEGYSPGRLHHAFAVLNERMEKGVNGVTRYGHRVSETLSGDMTTSHLDDPSLIERRDAAGDPKSILVSLWPLTTIQKHIDVVTIRFAFPRGPDKTEVHHTYFAPKSDDDALRRHRIRQASNLFGPSGFMSIEEDALYDRLHRGARAAGTVAFQKGYKGRRQAPYFGALDDEAPNLLRWEHYRKSMGFARD